MSSLSGPVWCPLFAGLSLAVRGLLGLVSSLSGPVWCPVFPGLSLAVQGLMGLVSSLFGPVFSCPGTDGFGVLSFRACR